MSETPKIRIGVRELRNHLTQYLDEAARGTPVIVTSRDKVIAEIGPPSPDTRRPRVPGALKGKIWIADDFDTWPDDILDAFES